MNETLVYLLKVSAAIALVTLPYYLVLRNDASLVVKRIYLVSGMLLSWIFPLLSVKKPSMIPALDPVFIIDPSIPAGTSAEVGITSSAGISAGYIFTSLYLVGIAAFLLINLVSYIRLTRHDNKASGNKNIILTNREKVFTIYPKIFLPAKYTSPDEINPILIHERAHLKQFHFADLLISELTLALTWFNPFSWLISRMIKENHEHLADREVLSQGVNPAHYKALLLNHAMGGEVFRLGHQFNHSLTKKRFNMMKKMKAKKKGSLKYILFVPMILVFTLMATAAGQQPKKIQGKVFLETNQVPATGATVLITGSTHGTVVDKDGTFSIEVTGNPDLTISFVGFENAEVSAKEIMRKPVMLVPTSYEIIPDMVIRDDISEKTLKIVSESGEEPVYVVDGKLTRSIDAIDPETIEKIEVYKKSDHPVVKKYNAKAGVVMVTTKSDKASTKSAIKEEKKDDEEVFYIVEELPRFPGGKEALGEYIYQRLEYPEEARKLQTKGKVVVEFKVNTDGSMDDIRISQSSNEMFNEAALEVFEDMPRWAPGKQRGKAVSCKILVPVRFEPAQE